MNKIGVLVFCLLLTAIPLVAAEINDTESSKIDAAYRCLENALANKTASAPPSLQESVFSILALGSDAKAEDKLENEKKSSSNSTCWPKSACTLKDTAQVLLAYNQLGKSTTSIENYLLSKQGATSGLTWFLLIDIDNHESASCTVKYSNTQHAFTIGEDMKLSGDGGTCLSVIQTGYWLEISSSCLDKPYEISCDKGFLTTLLYQKSGSDTIYVSPNTQSQSSSGYTTETITSKCFKLGTECDYEGSLWAALALDRVGRGISDYTPYLVAAAADNGRFLPESFLYKLTNGQDHYSALIQGQHSNQFWMASSTPYNKFYDSALALLALQGKDAPEIANAKEYFLGIQGSSGCWNNNNVRDTAFLLYAGWPDASRTPATSGNHTSSIESCESASAQYSCVSSLFACTGGNILDNYACPGSLQCCSVTVPQLTCREQQGILCTTSQECSSREVDSADGPCCLGSCTTRPTEEENACLSAGGVCQTSCAADEEELSSAVCTSSSEVCCATSTEPTTTSSSHWGLWITLIILIALVALAIVYRRKLQMWFFKTRKSSGNVSSSPITPRRPPFSPGMPPTVNRYPARPAKPSSSDKEMEETLRKLREMSK